MRKPRNLAHKAGRISNDYGQIPFLRRPDKRVRRKAASMLREPIGTF